MAVLNVGDTERLLGNYGHKDAFHVAGILSGAIGWTPNPGDSVRFVDSDGCVEPADSVESRHGIVDPFIRGEIPAGNRFWVFVEPRFVGNLSHQFEVIGLDELEEDDFDDDGCRGCY